MDIANGTLSSLTNAGTNNTDDVEKILLNGDLSQMGIMSRVLREAGFDVRHSDIYPVIQGYEIPRALKHLWDQRVDGWWNNRGNLIKYGICTADEFMVHLRSE
jgi:hypothetical protein